MPVNFSCFSCAYKSSSILLVTAGRSTRPEYYPACDRCCRSVRVRFHATSIRQAWTVPRAFPDGRARDLRKAVNGKISVNALQRRPGGDSGPAVTRRHKPLAIRSGPRSVFSGSAPAVQLALPQRLRRAFRNVDEGLGRRPLTSFGRLFSNQPWPELPEVLLRAGRLRAFQGRPPHVELPGRAFPRALWQAKR
jgi:hypothetical protein